MTAVELIAKQDKQSRIDRLVQADRRAKRRDFDIRYGNHRRTPYGSVRHVTTRKKQPQRETIGQALWSAGGWLVIVTGLMLALAVATH